MPCFHRSYNKRSADDIFKYTMRLYPAAHCSTGTISLINSSMSAFSRHKKERPCQSSLILRGKVDDRKWMSARRYLNYSTVTGLWWKITMLASFSPSPSILPPLHLPPPFFPFISARWQPLYVCVCVYTYLNHVLYLCYRYCCCCC